MQRAHVVVPGEIGLEQRDVDDGRHDVVDGRDQALALLLARGVVVQREVVVARAGECYGGCAADCCAGVS
jgi:hypothetical protein